MPIPCAVEPCFFFDTRLYQTLTLTTLNLAPAVSIRRPPCPRGSVVPFDPVPTDSAAEIVPIASANIAVTIHVQCGRVAVFVSRF